MRATNADETIRDLTRAARTGDVDALERLAREGMRRESQETVEIALEIASVAWRATGERWETDDDARLVSIASDAEVWLDARVSPGCGLCNRAMTDCDLCDHMRECSVKRASDGREYWTCAECAPCVK